MRAFNFMKIHQSLSGWGVALNRVVSWGRGHDALVTDLLAFVGLLKFSVGNSGVMSAS